METKRQVCFFFFFFPFLFSYCGVFMCFQDLRDSSKRVSVSAAPEIHLGAMEGYDAAGGEMAFKAFKAGRCRGLRYDHGAIRPLQRRRRVPHMA